MSFRVRIAVGAAAAVALAVVLASAVVYVVAREQLRAPIDEALERRAAEITARPLAVVPAGNGEAYLAVQPQFGEARGYVQLVNADGDILVPPRQETELPVDEDVLDVAGNAGEAFWRDTTVDGQHLRVFTFAYGPGSAVQVARPLSEVDQSLERLGLFLLLIAAIGIAMAAVLGLVVSQAALAPVRRLTGTAERVTKTGDLSERIEVTGRDELSRLAASFNSMLAALEESTRAQRQLVADASHELRTPLTSLRTNIEVLASDRALPAGDRGRLLSDVVEQLGEMTTLIAELIELARAEQHTAEPEDVRLDLVAREPSSALGATTRRSCSPRSSRSPWSTGFRRRSSALSGTCSTTPQNGASPEPRSSWTCAREPCGYGITAPASPRRICPTSSTASTGRARREACRDPGWGSRSCGRWSRRTAGRYSPREPKAAARE